VKESALPQEQTQPPLAELESRLRAGGDAGNGAAWAECRVSSTPVMFSGPATLTARLVGAEPSLTPHCLN